MNKYCKAECENCGQNFNYLSNKHEYYIGQHMRQCKVAFRSNNKKFDVQFNDEEMISTEGFEDDIDGSDSDGYDNHDNYDNHYDDDPLSDNEVEDQFSPPVGGSGHCEIYTNLQKKIMRSTYGEKAIYSKDFQEYADTVKEANKSAKSLLLLKLYSFGEKCKLSRELGDSLLQLIEECRRNREIKLPRGWKAVKGEVSKLVKPLSFRSKTVEWPPEWNMNRWDNGKCPDKIILRCRDPLECIAYKFLDPSIMFGWRDHIQFDFVPEYKVDGKTRTYGDLMTSKWAENTEENIRKTNKGSKLLPIILYHDGVLMGNAKGAHTVTVLGACGNFSDELLRTNESKFCLGFISGNEGINKTKLVQHLKSKSKPPLSTSAAVRSIKKILLHIDREFFRIALEPLLLYKDAGVLMHTLGESGAMKHFIPVLAFHGKQS